MADSVRIHERFYNIESYKKQEIRDLVEKNLDKKMSSYLKSIKNKKDAEIVLDYKIERNKRNKYDAKFLLSLDGQLYVYSPKVPFKFSDDVVNHAFDHFKLTLAG